MKNLIMLSLIFSVGCVNTDPLDKTPYFDPQKVYCPKGSIQLCKGTNKRDLSCQCVSSIRIPDNI